MVFFGLIRAAIQTSSSGGVIPSFEDTWHQLGFVFQDGSWFARYRFPSRLLRKPHRNAGAPRTAARAERRGYSSVGQCLSVDSDAAANASEYSVSEARLGDYSRASGGWKYATIRTRRRWVTYDGIPLANQAAALRPALWRRSEAEAARWR